MEYGGSALDKLFESKGFQVSILDPWLWSSDLKEEGDPTKHILHPKAQEGQER